MRRTLLLLTVLFAAAPLFSCAPSLALRRRVPPTFNLGDVERVGTQVHGEQTVAALVHELLDARLSRGRFYTVVADCAPNTPCAPVQALFRAAVTEVSTRTDEVTTSDPTPDVHVTVAVRFDVVRSDGVLLATKTYSQTEKDEVKDADVAKLTRSAVEDLVRDFVQDVTPRWVTEYIELDDTGGLKEGVKLAEAGDLPGAEASWSRVLQQAPQSAGALYNLGVAAELRGDFDRARDLYGKAIALSNDDLYRAGLSNMDERLRQSQLLPR